MKKLLIVITILLLSGCSGKQEENLNEVNVNIVINHAEMVLQDDGSYQSDIIRQEIVLRTFEITQIELLENGWGEFPYISSFIDKTKWDSYLEVIKEIFAFNEKSEITIYNSGIGPLAGPKAKLIITLQSDNLILECEFYQNRIKELASMRINYFKGEDIDASFIEYGLYDNFYPRLNDIINE